MTRGRMRTRRTGNIADLPRFGHAVGVIDAGIADEVFDRATRTNCCLASVR